MPKLTLRAITPTRLLSSKDYRLALEKAAQKTARLVERDLEATTRTWKHKPDFDVVTTEIEGDLTITAGTDDKRYGWIDAGTDPYTIRPKRSKYLRFRVGGLPKTRTGIIGSSAGRLGNEWRTAREVKHPGIKARKFTDAIRRRRQKTLDQEVRSELAKLERKRR